jgi:hypothetical protein
MSIFEITKDSLVPVSTTTFAAEHIRERYDLQRLLRDNIGAVAPETYVLAEEYGEWEDAKRRIDLLCIDKQANLVVVELKRTEDGGQMELQAIRYAAMVSKLRFTQAVEAHSRYLGGADKEEQARGAILKFLEWDEPNEKAFAQDVRIILVSAEFSKEITTSALWLNERELDIRCVRLRPYTLGDRVLLDIQQVLPLPEAEEYQVQIRKKAAEERLSSTAPWSGLWYYNVGQGNERSWEDMRKYSFIAAGGGRNYSDFLKKLATGDRVFAYVKQEGYVGFGIVAAPSVPVREFMVNNAPILKLPLQGHLGHDSDDLDKCEYLVAMEWRKTLPCGEAEIFPRAFANQNIVCKLRQPATIDFLRKIFPVDTESRAQHE